MALSMEHYFPDPIRTGSLWQHQGYQTWYRSLDGTVVGDMNTDDHLIPLIHGCNIMLSFVKLTGNMDGLVFQILVSLSDMTGGQVDHFNHDLSVGGFTTSSGDKNVEFLNIPQRDIGLEASFWGATHMRPNVFTKSTGASTIDVCISQTPYMWLGNSGR